MIFMSGAALFHLSSKKRRRRHSLIARRLLIVVLVLLSLIVLFNLRLAPLLVALSEIQATNTVEELLSSAVSKELQRAPALYSDLITLRYKSDGSVSSLSADTARLLSIRTTLLLRVLEAFRQAGEIEAEVPLSSLLGLNFLSSRTSFSIPLRLERELNGYFASAFEERGINQTHHRISFYVTVKIAVLVPSRTRYVTVSREFPFAETVIVGDVPDAYTKIDRLTSDITETEIDDLYDFGAAQ